MQTLRTGPGYVFRFPTKCVAVIILATSLLSNILALAYELLVHHIILKKVVDWCLRLLIFRSTASLLFPPYSFIDLPFAYFLFTSTKLGNELRLCLCRAKYIRNKEIILLFFNIWWGYKHPYSDADMYDTAMYVGLFQLWFKIVIIWLYVQELEKAVKNDATILEITPPQLPQPV